MSWFCACGRPGTMTVCSYEYEPRAKDKRGVAFREWACASCGAYLIQAATELGFPVRYYRVDAIPDDWMAL